MMNFAEANELVASLFFNREMAKTRVWLNVTGQLIDSVPMLGGVEGLRDLVTVGDAKCGAAGVCNLALNAFSRWRLKRSDPYPPYILHLAFLTLAAATTPKAIVAQNAYYKRLYSLLNQEWDLKRPEGFDEIPLLWNDLQRWSQVDRAGELGIFEVPQVAFRYVGIPIAQTLLTTEEIALLPSVFRTARYQVGSQPHPSTVALDLVKYGQGVLRARTIKLLHRGSSDQARAVLLDHVRVELDAWNGSQSELAHKAKSGVGNLRLFLQLDDVRKRAEVAFRCLAGEGSAPTLQLRSAKYGSYSCSIPFSPGWTAPLKCQQPAVAIDRWNLCEGIQLDSESGTPFRIKPAIARVLVDCRSEGVSGLGEIRAIPEDSPFYLLVSEQAVDDMQDWGDENCDRFCRWGTLQALNPPHVLFHAWRLKVGAHKPAGFTMRFSGEAKIRMDGGLTARPGVYLQFAPPHIAVTGFAPETMQVLCNGLPQIIREQRVLIHDEPRTEAWAISIGQTAGKETLARRTVRFFPTADLRLRKGRFYLPTGAPAQWPETEQCSSGSVVLNCDTPVFPWDLVLPTPFSDPAKSIDISQAEPKGRQISSLAVGEIEPSLIEWRENCRDLSQPEPPKHIGARLGGTQLWSGMIQYVAATRTGCESSAQRAIFEFFSAADQGDEFIEVVAELPYGKGFSDISPLDQDAQLERTLIDYVTGRSI
jgi:hypothetical protein